MQREQTPQFIGEPIRLVPGSSDLTAMARGEPGMPLAFVWRNQRYDVARLIESRRSMGQDRGDVYVRRHYYDIETADALRMTIYFDRNPSDRSKRKQWWLYTVRYPDPVVETERLLLRRWTWADRDAFHRMVSDLEIMRYVHNFKPLAPEEADQALLETIAHYGVGYGDWAIVERVSGDIMGECGLTHVQVSDDIEITWLLHPQYWGRGFGHEAASAVMSLARRLGLHRLIAHVQPGNERSVKLLRKLGFEPGETTRDRFGESVLSYTTSL